MAEQSRKAVPPGYVVLDGKWVRNQAVEAMETFVAPVKGVASFVIHGPRNTRGEAKTDA